VLGLNQSIDDCRAGFARVTREQVMAVARCMRLDTVYFQRGTGVCDNDMQEEEIDDV
jgi:hypothetical protein